jgi:phage-related protein
MAFDGSVPCWIPDRPLNREDDVRVRTAQFGDGYRQRTLDGINALDVRWSLIWENRENTVINAMVDYLKGRKGNSFNFREQQTGIVHQVWCDSWRVSWNIRRRHFTGFISTPLYYGTLTADFVKAYGVTA